MKTKFTAVVKIKKKRVDDIQNSIFAVDALIAKTKAELADIKNRFNKLEPPRGGSFSTLIAFEDMKKAFRYEIETITLTLANHQNQKNMLIAALREANTEYEKMKHLENEEIARVAKLITARESKELDEIGVMLYNNRRDD